MARTQFHIVDVCFIPVGPSPVNHKTHKQFHFPRGSMCVRFAFINGPFFATFARGVHTQSHTGDTACLLCFTYSAQHDNETGCNQSTVTKTLPRRVRYLAFNAVVVVSTVDTCQSNIRRSVCPNKHRARRHHVQPL